MRSSERKSWEAEIFDKAKEALTSLQKSVNEAKAAVLLSSEVGDLNAVEFLTAQHREVEALFQEFETSGEKAFRTKEALYEKIAAKLLARLRSSCIPALHGDGGLNGRSS